MFFLQVQRYSLSVFIVLNIVLIGQASASHIAGAELSYQFLRGNTYKVNYVLYRDCSGIAAPPDVNLDLRSAQCGQTLFFTLYPTAVSTVSRLCPGFHSSCEGGSIRGIERCEYSNEIEINQACADWKLSVTDCCRSAMITTIENPGQSNLYIEALLNNVNGQNSSAHFSGSPNVDYRLQQLNQFAIGSEETDGDSLSFRMVAAKTGPDEHVQYHPAYSAGQPMSTREPISMDPRTGNCAFTPIAMEIGIMCIEIDEFRNGILIGSVCRDFQFDVSGSSEHLPFISGMNGGQTDELHLCAGDAASFTFNVNDAVEVVQENTIPGTQFQFISGTVSQGKFSWMPGTLVPREQPYLFSIRAIDHACPLPAFSIRTFRVYVSGPQIEQHIQPESCTGSGDGSIGIEVQGGSAPFSSSWKSMTGNILFADQLSSGVYPVTISDAAGCRIYFEATITSHRTMEVQSSLKAAGCSSNDGKAILEVKGGNAPYLCSWFNDHQTGLVVNGLSAGIHYFTLRDGSGCLIESSVNIPGGSPLVSITGIEDAKCKLSSDGKACVNFSGGIAPYSVSWNSITNNSLCAEHLSKGIYTVRVNDSNGCSGKAEVEIHDRNFAPLPLLYGTINSCLEHPVLLDAGPGFETYHWNIPGDSRYLEVKSSGLYSVEVTDQDGCSGKASARVSFEDCNALPGFKALIYPNPTSRFIKLEIDADLQENVLFELCNSLGQVLLSSPIEAQETMIDLSGFQHGTFFLRIHSEHESRVIPVVKN